MHGVARRSFPAHSQPVAGEDGGKRHSTDCHTFHPKGGEGQCWELIGLVSGSGTHRPEFQTQICHPGLNVLLISLKSQFTHPRLGDCDRISVLVVAGSTPLMDGILRASVALSWGLLLWLELHILSQPLSQTLVLLGR